jgi:DNA-binding GntR family transcriptional regulator
MGWWKGGHLAGQITNQGYLAFFQALLDGRIKLGETLTLEALCDRLGISLSPLRESVTLLEAEGLITVRRRVGITIFFPDVEFVGNSYQLRGLLEREGLRKFTRVVERGWIERQRAEHRRVVEQVTTLKDPLLYREPMRVLEADFHGSFIDSFRNSEIRAIYDRLVQKMFVLRLLHPDSVGVINTLKAMEEHMAIVDALEKQDAEGAVVALERHLSGVLHRVLAK